MESVEIIDESAKVKPKNFIVADYMNSSFSMFSGTTQEVKLRFDNQLINAVIDRFRKNITVVADGDTHFMVRVMAETDGLSRSFVGCSSLAQWLKSSIRVNFMTGT